MNKTYKYLVVIFFIIASLCSYSRILNNDFINFDDNVYITENHHIQSGIHPESIQWAFGAFLSKNWHPLTWISHMLDWSLFGGNPSGHHLVNLLLHIGAVLFLFFFLNKTTQNVWPSAFVAAFFALHPLRVESVAWAAERKDVLSMFFGTACLDAYACYASRQKLSQYLLCLVLFIFGLMAKSMLVTLPFIFMLIDYWPLNRWQEALRNERISVSVKRRGHRISNLLLEKLPFVILVILSSVMTVWAQYVADEARLPFTARIANAVNAYIAYLIKIFWPVDLAVYYPFEPSFSFWRILFFFFILIGISVFCLQSIKKKPFLFVGWFWYMGALIPVIGLVPVNAPLADRYTYLPSIGIAIMLVWSTFSFVHDNRFKKYFLFPAGISVLMTLAFLTSKQCGYWKNDLELFSQTLRVTKNNELAHNNFGLALFKEGYEQEAIHHFNRAISIKPHFDLPYYNRGNAYFKLGLFEKAIADYDYAIRLDPDFAEGYYSRGDAFVKLGQYQKALHDFDKAILLRPDYSKAYNNRGIVYGMLRRYDLAIKNFNESLHRQPDYASAYCNRGFAFYQLGRYENAIDDYSKAIILNPHYARAYFNRADAYLKLGQDHRAADDLNKAVSLKKDHEEMNQ